MTGDDPSILSLVSKTLNFLLGTLARCRVKEPSEFWSYKEKDQTLNVLRELFILKKMRPLLLSRNGSS